MPIIIKGQILSADEINKVAFDRASDSDFANLRKAAEAKATQEAVVYEKRKKDDRLISYKDSVFISDMIQSSKE
jgi:hypothetical protein